MHSAGGLESSSQTETQQEVGAGGPRQSSTSNGGRKLDYLATVGVFLSLRTTDAAFPRESWIQGSLTSQLLHAARLPTSSPGTPQRFSFPGFKKAYQ